MPSLIHLTMTTRGSRRGIRAAVFALSLLAACSTDKLLSVERIGTILPSTVSNSAGADALRLGGVLSLNAFENTPWLFTDQFTDVWNCSNSSIGNCTFDQRSVPNTDANALSIWSTLALGEVAASSVALHCMLSE